MQQTAERQFMRLLRKAERKPVLFQDSLTDPSMLPETKKLIRAAVIMNAMDGGEGSGNFNHEGRPGQVGGSGKGGGSSSSGSKAAWKSKIESQKAEVMKLPPNKQALFAFKSGLVEKEDAVAAMKNGTAAKLVDRYFEILERNGDTESPKPVLGQADQQIIQDIQSGKYNDYTSARIGYIQDYTGQSEEEAKKTYKQLSVWFGGSWSRADTAVIDKYIEEDGTCEGPLYRGMHFSQQEYAEFMKNVHQGELINMRGQNSSWTTDPEVAYTFSSTGERNVRIKCLKNRTAAPVSHLSEKGESEALAHSRAQWTVLNAVEGASWTEITVVECEEYMPKETKDAKPVFDNDGSLRSDDPEHSEYVPLAERMQQQAKNIGFSHVENPVPPVISKSTRERPETEEERERSIKEFEEMYCKD